MYMVLIVRNYQSSYMPDMVYDDDNYVANCEGKYTSLTICVCVEMIKLETTPEEIACLIHIYVHRDV